MAKGELHILVEQDSEGYYVASVREFPECHTQAKSLDTLMKRIREAIEVCLEAEDPIPGKLSDTLVFEHDIVSPLGEDLFGRLHAPEMTPCERYADPPTPALSRPRRAKTAIK